MKPRSSSDAKASSDDLARQKSQLRADMRRRREADCDRVESSRRIHERLVFLSELVPARTLAVYVSTAVEVQTHSLIAWAWQQGKRVAVPSCRDGELRLFELHSMADLMPRTMGILEPIDRFLDVPNRWLEVGQIDLFLVPGLAFDRSGGRLGHGKGYYDRLLGRAAPESPKIALAFAWQLLDAVPMDKHDIPMNVIVTEDQIYRVSQSRQF